MILLVEDNEDDVFFLKRALKKMSITAPIHVAINGREALNYFKAQEPYADRAVYPIPSFVFLDLKIPFHDGFEILTWLQEQSALRNIPVAILTSSPEFRDREKSVRLGAKAFLVKPPTTESLQQIRHLLPGESSPAPLSPT